jgi:nucleoid-associated protein YgaU
MALAKLQIYIEKQNIRPKKGILKEAHFEPWISALFNPDKLIFNKSVTLAKQAAAQNDVPEGQFINGQSRTLRLDLIFDTYDTPEVQKEDVRKSTQKLFQLTTVDGDKHRPPVSRLFWGVHSMFFQGILEQLEQQFTLFMEDGMPVRATARCTFKEWQTKDYKELNQQDRQSSDVAKTWVVKRGETLSGIAAEEYRDPGLWRPIAAENEIDDPLSVVPGTVLLIPTLTQRNASGRYAS